MVCGTALDEQGRGGAIFGETASIAVGDWE
jgi:hypothetical protein